MICSSCQQTNSDEAEVCFTCGKALHALTQGAVLASRYVIRQSLGRGGMGYVYRAYDRMLEEDVAIKVIRAELVREPEMARRFRSETRLARKVSHRNVCRIHEYGEDGGIRFLSMEFVEGVDLKRLLRDGPLPPALGYEVAVQAADGLQAVHAYGIIHRDLKPSNLMVDRRGVVRLMDFGIAKEAEAEAGHTGSGQMMGTPEYMSPEHARWEKVGYPSDVYALGCVLYEVFVGAPPFHADTPLNTMYMHLHDPPPLGTQSRRPLPEALEPLLRRALSKKAADRYTAAAFAAALREARAASGAPSGDLASAVAGVLAPAPASSAAEGRPRTLLMPDPGRPISSTPEAAVTTTLGSGARQRRTWSASTAVSSRRWRWAFGIVAGGSALAVLVLSLIPRAPVEAPPETVPTTSVAAAPSPEPADEPAAATPLPPERPSPSLPPPLERRPSARPSPLRPSPARASAISLPPAQPAPVLGTLSLVIVPPAEVTVDGTSLGTVSIREVPVAPGAHVVRILHPDFKPLQRKVTVEAGATERVVIDLAEKGIRRPRGSSN